MLTVWGRTNSLNVQKVLWLAGELGLAYRLVPAGGRFAGLDTPAFRAMNPHGRIPVVADGGEPIWESHTILRYLAARYGVDRFWSETPERRALWEKWMDWSLATLQPALMGGVFRGLVRTPAEHRNEARLADDLSQTHRSLALLDSVLSDRAYLCGDAPTLADIAIGAMLYRYFTMPIDRPDLLHLRLWYDRLRQRDAYRTHVMVSYDDLWGVGG